MSAYKLLKPGVQRIADGASLPCYFSGGQLVLLDEHSPIVKDFQRWLALGNTPDPADPDPVPDPRIVLDAAEQAAVKADSQVQTFLNFSPAQLDAWVDANIANGASKTAFKVLGRIALAAGRGRTLR